jgi:hypothetical protein
MDSINHIPCKWLQWAIRTLASRCSKKNMFYSGVGFV